MAIHIYHYNVHAEQRYFLGMEHRDLYDLIAINGNIVSHTPAAVAAFIARAGKQFFIDPQTHAFQHATIHLKVNISDPDSDEPPRYAFKPSIEKLATEMLGEPFASVIREDRPLSVGSFLSTQGKIKNNVVKGVCERVVAFQTKTMTDSLDEEARELLGSGQMLRPKFVVSPYFYLSAHSLSDWLLVNRACYETTKHIVKDLPVFLALVISKDALEIHLEKVASTVNKLKPDGVLLWIDEHVEENLGEAEISRFVDLIKKLSRGTDTILNLHGGYLSVLLAHEEVNALISGVGHSINYGENRPVVPIGGGIPLARFYFPSIHSRLRFGDALGILLSKKSLTSLDSYRRDVCMCARCTELLRQKNSAEAAFFVYGESKPVTLRRRSGSIVRLEFPTKEAKEAAARHYLYNKKKEFDDLGSTSLGQLLKALQVSYENILPFSGDSFVAHLLNWHQAVHSLKKNS